MRSRLVVVLILAAGLTFSLVFARQLIRSRELSREGWIDKPVRVLTYGTMVSTRGPAEPIFKRFELEHHVKLEVVVSTDVGLMIERLKVGGAFDLVIGIDQLLLDQARAEFKWRNLEYDKTDWFEAPAKTSDAHFAAIDWSPLTFIHRHDDQALPKSFDDLRGPRFKGQFTVSDPRGTTPGLQFARWVKANAGAGTHDWLKNFQPNVKALTPTWTAAYALFEQNQTRFVWTYLTSLAFHWGTQNDRKFEPLIFAEGHPVQVEMAAIPENCRECGLGQKLLNELLSPEGQDLIMKRNFMMPVKRGAEAGTVFAELPVVKTILPGTKFDPTEWNDVFTR